MTTGKATQSKFFFTCSLKSWKPTWAGGGKQTVWKKPEKTKSSSAFIPTDPEQKYQWITQAVSCASALTCIRIYIEPCLHSERTRARVEHLRRPCCWLTRHQSGLRSVKTLRTTPLVSTYITAVARYSSEPRRAGYRSVEADTDMMANALRLGAVPFWAGAVTQWQWVWWKIQSGHMSLRLAVTERQHSRWLSHLDDNFFHCLRYNSVERGGAIFHAGRIQVFERVNEGFTFFHGQRIVLQARIAVRRNSKTNNNLNSRFHPCGHDPVDQHADFLFFYYYFWICPKTYAGGGQVTKNLLYA